MMNSDRAVERLACQDELPALHGRGMGDCPAPPLSQTAPLGTGVPGDAHGRDIAMRPVPSGGLCRAFARLLCTRT